MKVEFRRPGDKERFLRLMAELPAALNDFESTIGVVKNYIRDDVDPTLVLAGNRAIAAFLMLVAACKKHDVNPATGVLGVVKQVMYLSQALDHAQAGTLEIGEMLNEH